VKNVVRLQPTLATLDQAYQSLIQGELETALELGWRFHTRFPENAAALKLLGLAYEFKGNGFAELAYRFLREAKARGMDDSDVNIGLARTYLQQERFAEALLALDDASRHAETDSFDVIDFQRGLCLYAQREWQAAIAVFQRLLESTEYSSLAAGWLGVIAACRGDSDEALRRFEGLSLDGDTEREENRQIFQCHCRDILANRKLNPHGRRILILRHAAERPYFYQVFLDWLTANYPEYRGLFELRLLPCPPLEIGNYALHLPWLQDPVQNWSAQAFDEACALEALCVRHGVPVINPVSRLANAGKREGATRIAKAGLRTPRIVAIDDIDAFRRDRGGLEFPFFVREDWGHGGMIERIEDDGQLAQVRIERYRRPIAIELIDVMSADGLYRKYRYFAIGNHGISHHLLTTRQWITRGADRIYDPQTRAEELAFIASPNPHHAQFQQARRELELDYVAFDYGYDRSGRVVVWEANPYPFIHWPAHGGKSEFRVAALHRTLATMLLFYLESAGIDAPAQLRCLACYDPAGEAKLAEFVRP
jgi:tetratricopeptide (TPR) repeat protein